MLTFVHTATARTSTHQPCAQMHIRAFEARTRTYANEKLCEQLAHVSGSGGLLPVVNLPLAYVLLLRTRHAPFPDGFTCPLDASSSAWAELDLQDAIRGRNNALRVPFLVSVVITQRLLLQPAKRAPKCSKT